MTTATKIAALPQIVRRKRVAAYTRVSSGKDSMRHSLSAQVSYYNALIQRHIEWEFAGVYVDDPISGTKNNRAEFQRMLTDCRVGKIDMIITKSVTRFARNTLTTLETIRELKDLGVDVFFEKENIHSQSGDGELMLSILASYAQEESRSVSENCKWRIRKMFQAGRPNTGNMLGYRLKDGRLQIVPNETEIAQQIFTDYLNGMGVNAIAKALNAAGIPTKRGGLWTKNTIHKILRNEKYCGALLLQKTFVIDHLTKRKSKNIGQLPQYHVENSHEAIIDREIFAAVQAEIAHRAVLYQPRKPAQSYVFTGLIRCGKCGASYRCKHTHIGSKYEKTVWICSTFNALGEIQCSSQQIPNDILLQKTAEVGGVEQIAKILVPDKNRLTFILKDGSTVEAEWQHPSRRESWTAEMKQVARERQNRIIEERRCRNERG